MASLLFGVSATGAPTSAVVAVFLAAIARLSPATCPPGAPNASIR